MLLVKNFERAASALAAVVATGLTVLLSGCGAPADTEGGEGMVFEQMAAQGQNADVVWAPSSLREVLPNQLYSMRGGEPEAMGPGTVVGSVESAKVLAGYWTDDFAPGDPVAHRVDPGDEKAAWATMKVTVKVDKASGAVAEAGEVSFACGVDAPTAEKTAKDTEELDDVIVVLGHQGFFDEDPDLYSVVHNCALFGDVTDGTAVRFPGMDDEEEEFIGALKTVDQVFDAAAGDQEATIALDYEFGRPHN